MTRPALPHVAPPPDGLASAFREARRRRHRSAAASGSAGLVAVVVLLGSVADGGSTRLVQQPADPATQSRVVLGPDRPEHRPTTSPVLTDASPVGSVLRPGSAGRASVDGSVDGVRPTTPAADRRPGPQRPRALGPTTGTSKRQTGQSTFLPEDIVCVARTGQALCSSVSVSTRWNSPGHEVRLYTCNKSANRVSLRFSHREEARFEVQQEGEVLFRTTAPVVADEHEVWVDPGLCLAWTTSWSGTRADGSAVEGTVRASATLLADGAGSARTASRSYRPADYRS